ncbi:uncharacterized protein [Apostichopus japonicus]|uniref:uncharacterized protein isoform X4 n=1 Tax=Stichopus japonicus TaxID=307972 RepID=UPI003AB430FD
MCSLEMIFGDHMMRILHSMVYNMLMVMVLQFSTYLLYISFKKVKEKVELEHITADITSIVDVSLISTEWNTQRCLRMEITVERSGNCSEK